MKEMKRLLTISLLTATVSCFGQIWPYSGNNWSNPEFVDRFMGSYGFETSREPKITSEEAELFQQVATAAEISLEEAVRIIQEGIGPESSAALHYTLANLHLQLGNAERAKISYRAAIKAFPNFMRAYKNLGLALIQEGNYEEARGFLIKAVELGDGSGNTYGLLAFCYLNTGDLDSALDAYSIAGVLMPDNKDWKVGKAHALLQTGQYRSAVSAFENLISMDADNVQYYISRSNAFLYLGEYESAALHLEIVRRMGNASGSSLVQLGNLYLNMENGDLAVDVFVEALKAKSSIDVPRSIKIANNLIARYLYDEALLFVKAIWDSKESEVSKSDRLELLNIEAELQLAMGDDAEAAEILEKVVSQDPTNGRAFILLGNYNWNQGEIEEASYYFEAAQAIESTRYTALIDHARMCVGEKDYEKAVDLLKSAVSIQPKESLEKYLDAVQRVYEQTRI
jgi:tetratricopeptide (TPR) repeat protein